MNNNFLYIVTVVLTSCSILVLLFMITNRFIDELMYSAFNNKELDKQDLSYKQVSLKYKLFKRVFDIVLSLMGLLVFILYFPIIAVAIKLESNGPIFFRAKRIGVNKKVYYVYKFRTVYADMIQAEGTVLRLSDRRLTRVGQLLRKTSLDEMTLFLNVLKGDMSCVGRSRAIEFLTDNDRHQWLYNLKPGIVSLWAISRDRLEGDATDIIHYDLLYASMRSFLFDTMIIARTIALSIGFIGNFKVKK